MRRATSLPLALAALALLVSPVAGEAGPTREPYDPEPLIFEAGLVCPFSVELATEDSRAHQLTFPADEAGTVRIVVNGSYLTRVTNLDSGESKVLHAFGPATILMHADGSMDLATSGPSILYFFPGDAIEGLLLATGRYRAHLSAENIITEATITGPVVDLCSSLA